MARLDGGYFLENIFCGNAQKSTKEKRFQELGGNNNSQNQVHSIPESSIAHMFEFSDEEKLSLFVGKFSCIYFEQLKEAVNKYGASPTEEQQGIVSEEFLKKVMMLIEDIYSGNKNSLISASSSIQDWTGMRESAKGISILDCGGVPEDILDHSLRIVKEPDTFS